MKTADKITCRCCGGTGYIELTGVRADTLALLRTLTHEHTGAALANHMNCKPTAMNNRLAALEDMGFVTSRVYGKRRFYRAKKLRST